jgi:hypothetical protein
MSVTFAFHSQLNRAIVEVRYHAMVREDRSTKGSVLIHTHYAVVYWGSNGLHLLRIQNYILHTSGCCIVLTHANINPKYDLLFCNVFRTIASPLSSAVAHCCTVQSLQQSFGSSAARLRSVVSISSWHALSV